MVPKNTNLENRIEPLAQHLVYLVTKVGPQVLPHPFGAVEVPMEERKANYMRMAENPQAIAAWHATRSQQVGERLATAELLDEAEKMQRLIEADVQRQGVLKTPETPIQATP